LELPRGAADPPEDPPVNPFIVGDAPEELPIPQGIRPLIRPLLEMPRRRVFTPSISSRARENPSEELPMSLYKVGSPQGSCPLILPLLKVSVRKIMFGI